MVCRTTSTEQRRQPRQGFTLVEMMVAMGIASLAFAALGSFILYSGKSFAAMFNYVEMEQRSQYAIDSMGREIRNSFYVASYSTHAITLRDGDGELLTFSWSPSSRALVRVKGGATKTLLSECDYIAFSVWQRSPISGTWDNYSTATVTNAKLVNVNWRCSRKILGATVNTESVQTSKIVIRNR